MNDYDSEIRSMPPHGPDQGGGQPPSFWRSRTGIVLMAAFAIGGILLVAEHRAHLFGGGYWLWLLLFACVGMHLFMHGGHGGHGGGGDRS